MHGIQKTLSELRDGGLVADINAKLESLIEKVQKQGKPGKITINLTLKPIGSKALQFDVIDDVKVTEPKAESGHTILFAARGHLSRRDPRQPELPSMTKTENETTERGAAVNE